MDEVLPNIAKFPLAEAAECDGDGTAGETVRGALDAVEVCGSGEQEPAGFTVGVHGLLDCEEQFRGTLDLIDDQGTVAVRYPVDSQEAGGVGGGSGPGVVVIHRDDVAVAVSGDVGSQGALADLAPSLEDDDREMVQEVTDPRGGVAVDEVIHSASLADSFLHRGFAGTDTVVLQEMNRQFNRIILNIWDESPWIWRH